MDCLTNAGILPADSCGGKGECRRCRIILRDAHGIFHRLACQTQVTDGMKVMIDAGTRTMSASDASMQCKWGSDGEGWGYGFSIDVGTTTVMCRLYDLESGRLMGANARTNPQIVFGRDVPSRVNACSEGFLKDMSKLLGDMLVEMASELAQRAGIDLSEVSYTVLAGNTVMEHIAADISPLSVIVPPHEPPTLFGTEVDYIAFEQGNIASGTTFFVPCISGRLGGDIACGLLAIDVLHAEKPTLLLDLSTSAEVALGSPSGVIACATAAGPIFEGGNITYGMPAYPGAISKVRFSHGELHLTVVGGVSPMGICGTGLLDVAALMLDCGMVDASGRIVDDGEVDPTLSRGLEKLLCTRDGQRCLRVAEDIYVTQSDIRNLQIAKASVRAAILTLIEEKGLQPSDIGNMVIAGGFGHYLDITPAARVGFIPQELLHSAHCVGNSSIEGASALLLSDEANDELDSIIGSCSCLELSESETYQRLYKESLLFK